MFAPLQVFGQNLIETGAIGKTRQRRCARPRCEFDLVLVANTRGHVENDFDIERYAIDDRALRGDQRRQDGTVGMADIRFLQHVATFLGQHQAWSRQTADLAFAISVFPLISSI